MFKLNIKPLEKTINIDDKKSLLAYLRDNEIYIRSSCNGNTSCSDCVVKVLEGGENLNGMTFDEIQLLGNVFHITKERLACSSFTTGDLTIDVSSHNKEEDEKLRRKKSKKKLSKIKVRKKAKVEEILKDRSEKYEKKKKSEDSWKNHWEKDKKRELKRSGGHRPPKSMKDLELEEMKRNKLNEKNKKGNS